MTTRLEEHLDFQRELLNVKKISDCEDLASVDAYSDNEVVSGWLTCLEVVFEGIDTVKVLGQQVRLTGFDIERDYAVVATQECYSIKIEVRSGL